MAYFKNSVQLRIRPKAEIITIGTELLTGTVLDTNARFLAQALTGEGFEVNRQASCRDDFGAIQKALKQSLEGSDVICISGGLGPTPDDITRDALAQFFSSPLVLSQRQYRMISRYYRVRHRTVPKLVSREAYFPKNARPIFNRFGIALGFTVEFRNKFIVVLPGVPNELTRLFDSEVVPVLRKRFPGICPASVLLVKTVGISEPTIMKKLGSDFFRLGTFQFGIYPEVGEVSLRIYSDSKMVISKLKRRIGRVLRDHIYSFSAEGIAQAIGRELASRKWSVSVAESCTGGSISKDIVSVPGSSRYFLGGIVAYHNSVKEQLLSVPQQLLQSRGAVSRRVAQEMARGVRERFRTNVGLAVTGIAGPSGATKNKPVGLAYIALSTSSGSNRVWKERFRGDRLQIQSRASKRALECLWRWLRRR